MGKSGAFSRLRNLFRMRRIVIIVGTLGAAIAVILATGAYRTGDGGATAGATAPGRCSRRPRARSGKSSREHLAVGLTARRPERGGLDLAATVIGQDGTPVDGLDVTFSAPEHMQASGETCGSGCYAAALPLDEATAIFDEIAGRPPTKFSIPTSWRPAGKPVAPLTEAIAASRRSPYSERLESRPGTAITTSWKMGAPDRLAYVVAGGASRDCDR